MNIDLLTQSQDLTFELLTKLNALLYPLPFNSSEKAAIETCIRELKTLEVVLNGVFWASENLDGASRMEIVAPAPRDADIIKIGNYLPTAKKVVSR